MCGLRLSVMSARLIMPPTASPLSPLRRPTTTRLGGPAAISGCPSGETAAAS